MVLLHGIGCSHESFDDAFASVGLHGYSMCAFDFPGHGAAADLLSRNDDPSDDEIRHAIEGNICRCTGYQNIIAAVREAARVVRSGGAPVAAQG